MTFLRNGFVLAVAMLGFAMAGQAQVGVYGGITGERITSIQCLDPSHVCASNDGVARPYGADFGVYYQMRELGFVHLGADLRASVLNTNKSAATYQGGRDIDRHYGVLGGVRGEFVTRYKFVRPYAEALFGYAKTNAVTGSYQNFVQFQGLVGLDIPLGSVVEFRPIEFGAGGIFGPSTHGTQSIAAGLVFRFGRR